MKKRIEYNYNNVQALIRNPQYKDLIKKWKDGSAWQKIESIPLSMKDSAEPKNIIDIFKGSTDIACIDSELSGANFSNKYRKPFNEAKELGRQFKELENRFDFPKNICAIIKKHSQKDIPFFFHPENPVLKMTRKEFDDFHKNTFNLPFTRHIRTTPEEWIPEAGKDPSYLYLRVDMRGSKDDLRNDFEIILSSKDKKKKSPKAELKDTDKKGMWEVYDMQQKGKTPEEITTEIYKMKKESDRSRFEMCLKRVRNILETAKDFCESIEKNLRRNAPPHISAKKP